MYCSGRLNCESLTITMDLKPRQEAISRLWDLYMPLPPDQVRSPPPQTAIERFSQSRRDSGLGASHFQTKVVRFL